jgi:hypothetical protein
MASLDFSPRVGKGDALQAAGKRPTADNHPGALGAGVVAHQGLFFRSLFSPALPKSW